MDEFAKTKIGFTVALLAVVFAIKPLIDAYGGLGYFIFDYKITIQDAFFVAVGLLGVAVYFISLQFVSDKYVSFFEKVSNGAYALSLSVPIVYLALWLLVTLGGWLAVLVTTIPEGIWNTMAAIIAGVITSLLTSTINKTIRKKDTESKQEENRKKEIELLTRAEHMIDEGHYDLSLLESGKIMELSLRQAVTLASGESKMFSMHNLIQRAHKLNLVSESDLEHINSVRILRNNATHLDSKVTKEQAVQAATVAKRLVKTLSFVIDIAGYNWLRVNRSEAIRALQGNNKPLLKTVESHLWDAWLNRDGAVSGEISEFFEVALISNLQTIVDIFSNNENQLEVWLEQLDTQMFTDYIGGQLSKLDELKIDILASLESYIASSNNDAGKNIAHKIRNKINTISVREID